MGARERSIEDRRTQRSFPARQSHSSLVVNFPVESSNTTSHARASGETPGPEVWAEVGVSMRWCRSSPVTGSMARQMPRRPDTTADSEPGPDVKSGRWSETIFAGVNNRMRIAQEEVFGPVLSVIPFKDEEEAVSIGNDVVYGLAAGVWTQNMKRAFTMAERLQAGTVWVNTYRAVSVLSPFGGYKRSGLGRENGQDMIKEYMQTKSVWISTATEVPNPFVMR